MLITNNVPLPGARWVRYHDIWETVPLMKVGDSALDQNFDRNRGTSWRNTFKKYGFVMTSRKEGDGMRVWRKE